MLRLVLGAALALTPLVTIARPSIPSTPAGTAAKAWLAAFNSSDGKSLEAFDKKYRRDTLVDAELGFRDQTGGFTLLEVENTEPLTSELILREKYSVSSLRVSP